MKRKTMMQPWGTTFDNSFYLDKQCLPGTHNWKMSNVETRKIYNANNNQRFRLVTRTCTKCGKSEQTYIR